MQKILEYAETHEFGYVIKLLLHTGMRRGELLALKWENVDFANGTIKVNSALARGNGGEVIRPYTKGKRIRTIPIDTETLLLLQNINRDCEFVVSRNGRRYSTTEFQKRYNEFWDDMEVDIEDAPARKTAHKCRHTFASYIVKGGGDLRSLQELLGHADLEMTRKYTHINLDDLRNNISKLNYSKRELGSNCGQTDCKAI